MLEDPILDGAYVIIDTLDECSADQAKPSALDSYGFECSLFISGGGPSCQITGMERDYVRHSR